MQGRNERGFQRRGMAHSKFQRKKGRQKEGENRDTSRVVFIPLLYPSDFHLVPLPIVIIHSIVCALLINMCEAPPREQALCQVQGMQRLIMWMALVCEQLRM